MAFKKMYIKQTELLLDVLPIVFKEDVFALKGGTAINFFFHNMPRLSVDIDLTYIPIESRNETFKKTKLALDNITDRIKKFNSNIQIKEKKQIDNVSKLFIYDKETFIKIEPNGLLRGCVYPCEKMDLVSSAQNQFNRTILDIKTLAFEDIYGGKICAALSRQHCRDLFDILQLYKKSGSLSRKMITSFVVYLASSPKPISEMLNPTLHDITNTYNTEFSGMCNNNISLDELLDVRVKLIADVNSNLLLNEKEFLLSIKQGEPNWDLMPIEHLKDLPALKWKIINVQKMSKTKKDLMINKLKETLQI